MLRFIFWLLVVYIFWRIVQSVSRRSASRSRSSTKQQSPFPVQDRFANIQEAEFEDLTPKTDSNQRQPGNAP